jgi:hypothetical protein
MRRQEGNRSSTAGDPKLGSWSQGSLASAPADKAEEAGLPRSGAEPVYALIDGRVLPAETQRADVVAASATTFRVAGAATVR